jgi:uncharacterized YccA/Bax inhibitor family protein
MTIEGAVQKSLVLASLTLVSATFTYQGSPASTALMFGTSILAFIIALVVSFNPASAPVTAPIYAVVKGLFLGMVSSAFERKFHGLVAQSVMLTFGILFGMLGLYTGGIIRMTKGLSRFLYVSTAGVVVTYLLSSILGFCGVEVPLIHESGLIGIGFSAVVVVIAALNLIADFEIVEGGAEQGAPRYMEWYSGFALLVTVAWLYLEILNLLAKLRSQR